MAKFADKVKEIQATQTFHTESISRDADGIDTNVVMTTGKNSHPLLDVDTRNDILDQLKELGVYPDQDSSDADLIAKLSLAARSQKDKNLELEAKYLAPTLTQEINHISSITGIKNIEFCTRLRNIFHMTHMDYINLFREDDAKLTGGQLWERVRESGINKVADVQELFKPRYEEPNLDRQKRGYGVSSTIGLGNEGHYI